MGNYLEELNDSQLEAVRQIQGPLMVIAGPGSGKTRVLTYRIAYMIEQGIDPFNILSLTFTNKAAREMKDRIYSIVGNEARNLWMGTFHSVFARILRKEAHRFNFPSNFSIYDTDDTRRLIKNIIKEGNYGDKMYKPSVVHNRISAAKNALLTPKRYKEDINIISEDEVSGRPKMAEIYQKYWNRCKKANAMDFDDLLLYMYMMLRNFPDALYNYQQQFRYILIDEYQDTNHAQYAIIKILGDMYENICVVGDDAQSIYSFRGANIQNILNFERDYPDLKTVKLEQNYRSTKNIVSIANKVIVNNRKQLEKTIWTDNEAGQKVTVLKAASDNEEGRLVADRIFEESMRHHFRHDEFAILYRTNAQSRSFEEALRKKDMPYRIYGGISFYQRKEVKDLMAYLRLLVNPSDEEALRRVINYPTRGIGDTTMAKVTIAANDHDIPIWEVLEHIYDFGVGGRAAGSITQFVTIIKGFQAMLQSRDAYDLAMHVAKTTGILRELHSDKSIEGLSRFENVQELLNSIKEFTEKEPGISEDEALPHDPSLGSYLQQVSLLTDADNENDTVPRISLMTIHAAKGLEFPVVFVVGLEENLFPSFMSVNSREDLEEERRLFYVAITRAKQRLYLSHANTRYRYGNLIYCEPSRFLDEMPEDDLELIGASPKAAKPVGNGVLSRSPERKKQFNLPKPRPTVANHKASPNFAPDDPAKMQNGMEVEHQKFGFGKITSLEGSPDNRIAHIFFPSVGSKRIMLKYAKLMIKS